MDLSAIGTDLLKLSPLVFLLAVGVYVLWNNNQKTQATLLDQMKAHADDRKESQEKISQIVIQNSASNVQLAGSVDNLSKSVSDNTNRLTSLEGTVSKNNRATRLTAQSTK